MGADEYGWGRKLQIPSSREISNSKLPVKMEAMFEKSFFAVADEVRRLKYYCTEVSLVTSAATIEN